MQNIFFRDALLTDLEKIVDIYNATISSRMVTADTVRVSVNSKRSWFHNHSPEKRPLWLIENQQKKTFGWVSFQSFYGRPAYDATAEISIYIDEQHRGQGLGKLVLQHCLQQAPRLGINTLLGYIFAHNQASLQLFRHFDFEEWAHLPHIARMDDKTYSLKILGRRV